MFYRIRQLFSRLLLIYAVVLLLLLGAGSFTIQPALGAVRRIEEAPGQVLYQSRHTLHDRSGNSWQVVLFKSVKDDEPSSIYLRLVGFPGATEFAHPHPLAIATATGATLKATDVFAEQAPAANVSQYNLSPVLVQLQGNEFLKLSLPLTGGRTINLNIPSFVVQEWQQVAAY